MKYEIPRCLGRRGGAGDEDPEPRVVRQRGPDLLAVHDPLVAVAHRPGAERGQVGARHPARRTAGTRSPRPRASASGSAPSARRCPRAGSSGRPSRCRSGCRAARPGPAQLVVDDQLVDRVGVEPPGPGPVRHHVAGLGQLPAGRARVLARARRAPRGVGGRRRGQLEVHGRECSVGADRPVTDRRATYAADASLGPTRPHRRQGGPMPGWNFAELWETDRRRSSRRTRAGPGRPPGVTWAEFDRRADGVARHLLDAGARAPGQGRAVPLQRPEYLESRSPRSRPAWCRSTPTTATSTTSSAYLWDNADAWPWSSTAPSPTASRRCGALPKVKALAVGRRRQRPVPGLGHVLRGRRRPGPGAGRRRRGGRSGDDLLMIYTGGTTGMPKGVMWRQDDLIKSLVVALGNPAVRAQDPTRRSALDARSERSRPAWWAARLPAHARHRLVHRSSSCLAAPAASCCSSRHLDVEELLDTIEREKVNTTPSWATPSPSRSSPPSTPNRALGPVEPGHRVLVGRDVVRGGQAGTARHNPA
jgi:hypothetical protein